MNKSKYLFSCLRSVYAITLKNMPSLMTITEKYPENIPWDLNINQSKYKSIHWMLSKADIVYTFTRSRIDHNYVYIQKNDGKRKAYREHEARFTYQRLFDEGYSLAAFS
tara:strand:- start:6 stop:332 length:327 start_codon:yes stop_codon:yes gene_type:complete